MEGKKNLKVQAKGKFWMKMKVLKILTVKKWKKKPFTII